MKEIRVTSKEAGQRLNKFLGRIMPEAGTGFLYKMLRKKNITLNEGKADGSEIVREGDVVRVFFSDETFAKMSGQASAPAAIGLMALHPVSEEQIVYEDDTLMAVYKPAGVLSQQDDSRAESLNEQVLQYLINRGDVTAESMRSFKPGICNRLDRNTAGIVWFAKTLQGAQGMATALRDRIPGKYYFALLMGNLEKEFDAHCYLTKNEETNTVKITNEPLSDKSEAVHTKVTPVIANRRVTLARIRLYTGKSHQIRSVCKYLGYPVLGDPKYTPEGTELTKLLSYFRAKYHVHGQQLFAYAYAFPETVPEGLSELAGETITGIVPDEFAEILLGEFPKEVSGKEDVDGYLEIPGPAGLPV